ncbi:4'-phosphopantetheinyl transferase family protein [Aliamphritea spongicola]|uniref:4'-phosphopantetheinyl transferase family protein n=1 Tax=Aliamphritea spongicola TaxID=707589 RepID=UPI00196AF75F|nr:4'-phosphopantetheinyl transferase superfamily protein [Aliamphritea spongicola]MBN3564443.1 4'-phosphopantetheinyl transferase superfamily protein [Aliamphritea spongicola]
MHAGTILPITVWLTETVADTHHLEKQLLPLLFPSEQKRLNNISHSRKRREYITSRSLIRHVLKQLISQTDQPWEITEYKNSPPVVTHPTRNINLSLSHSHNTIALTATEYVLGIDIEYTRPRLNLEALAQSFMTLPEQQHFEMLPASKQTDFFYRCWCAKEATYKLRTVLGRETIPIEKLCTINRKKAESDIHLTETWLSTYNCQLSVAAAHPLTAIKCRFVSEPELI